jgi:hypothetical protein
VTVSSSPSGDSAFDFTRLAAGQSETRSYSRPCEDARDAVADSFNQVAETNESNNSAHFAFPFC